MKRFWGKFLAMLNIKNNFVLKVISLASAIFFWIFVMDTENPVVTRTFYNVPVIYAGETDPGLVVSSAPTYYSNVEISGRRNSVLATRSESFVLKVNLNGLKDGKNEAEIEYSTLLNDINIDRVSPSNVVVTLEKVISVEKPVFYYKTSNFETSLSNSVIVIEPTSMVIRGPRSLVADVVSVVAEIDVSEIKKSMKTELPLIPINSLGEKVEGIVLERDFADVTIHAVREKTVPFTYEYRDETDDNLKLIRFIITSNMVTISGDPSVVDSIHSLKAKPVVITGQDNATGVFEFEPVPGVTISNSGEIRYSGEFSEILHKDLVFTAADMQFENLGEGFSAEVDPSAEWNVGITGMKAEVENTAVKDFSIELDLSELAEGEHYIVPSIRYLSRYQITYKLLSESPIKVVITKKTEE